MEQPSRLKNQKPQAGVSIVKPLDITQYISHERNTIEINSTSGFVGIVVVELVDHYMLDEDWSFIRKCVMFINSTTSYKVDDKP
eukprot:UN08222